MRLIPIDMCEPGMKLGKSIYNEEGYVLLGAQFTLTESIIKRLRKYGINHVYIEDPHTEDIEVPDVISDETRIRALAEIRSAFRQAVLQPSAQSKSYWLGRDFRQVMSMVLGDLSNHQQAMSLLMNMSVTDNYLYQHSLNVCVYATILAMDDRLSREEMMTIGIGALLHDIGKTKVSPGILNKREKLTEGEFDEIKKHAEWGYKMLKDQANIPLLSAHCAYQHHERMDGSGYPRGIKGDEIHKYAKLLAIVDSYDAMTTHRIYRPAMLPHQALEILFAGAGSLYDMDQVIRFRDMIPPYPLGVTVFLQTGETGVVVDVNTSNLQRPIIRILRDADGHELKQPYEIDLTRHLTVMIAGVNGIKVENYL